MDLKNKIHLSFIFFRYENCQRVLNSEVTEIQFKIMAKNQNESLFNDYISLLFENSF